MTDPVPSTTDTDSPARRAIRLLLRTQAFFGLLATVILSTLLSPVRDGHVVFLSPDNLLNDVRFASENGVIAVGMTLVILTAGIDLSVGAILGLCSVGAAACLMTYHFGPLLSVVLILGLGAIVGWVNGFVTTKLNIQSFITTLAMQSVARGAGSLWAGGYAIPLAFGAGSDEASPVYKELFAGNLNFFGIGVPAPVFYFLGAGALAAFVLRRTGFGRHVFAVGSNEVASRLSGIAVDRVKIIVFTVSGLLSALAGLMHSAMVDQGNYIDGAGYELNAIAAVVIGGTRLSGGVGSVAGAMSGALILQILDNILGLRNVPTDYQMILKGVIIVLAVVLQRRR